MSFCYTARLSRSSDRGLSLTTTYFCLLLLSEGHCDHADLNSRKDGGLGSFGNMVDHQLFENGCMVSEYLLTLRPVSCVN